MNIERIYQSIIDRAKSENRVKGQGAYYESHHVIPRSMGGSNHSDNLVLLTGREHFICHLILARMYPDQSIAHAAFKMACVNNGKYGIITSRIYESLRSIHAKRVSEDEEAARKKSLAGKGRKQSESHIAARTASRKENGKEWHTRETLEKISNSAGTEYGNQIEIITKKAVPANGLVGWWPFNGNAKDESGGNLDGFVLNAVPTEDRLGHANQAYFFDGIEDANGDYIEISTGPKLSLKAGSVLTFSFWINSGDDLNYFLLKGAALSDAWYGIGITNGLLRTVTNGASATDSFSISPGTWTHIVVVFDGVSGNTVTYKNGVLQSEVQTAFPANDLNSPLRIGGLFGYPSTWNPPPSSSGGILWR